MHDAHRESTNLCNWGKEACKKFTEGFNVEVTRLLHIFPTLVNKLRIRMVVILILFVFKDNTVRYSHEWITVFRMLTARQHKIQKTKHIIIYLQTDNGMQN